MQQLVKAAYEQYRRVNQDGWGLAWYLAAEFCDRFYASHGIVPYVAEHEGLGYYGIELHLTACAVHGVANPILGRFSMAGNAENWRDHRGMQLFDRALAGEPLSKLLRDAIETFNIPPYPPESHALCRHKRWGSSYTLLFSLAALLALRHEHSIRIWNHGFHTAGLGRGYDPVYGQKKEHQGHFLFSTSDVEVLIAGDGRVILPSGEASLWERYMRGEPVTDLLVSLERWLGLEPGSR